MPGCVGMHQGVGVQDPMQQGMWAFMALHMHVSVSINIHSLCWMLINLTKSPNGQCYVHQQDVKRHVSMMNKGKIYECTVW